MIVQEGGFAIQGSCDGDGQSLGQGSKLGAGPGRRDTAACDDDGPFRSRQQACRLGDLGGVGRRPVGGDARERFLDQDLQIRLRLLDRLALIPQEVKVDRARGPGHRFAERLAEEVR